MNLNKCSMKTKIIQTALRLFLEKGYINTTSNEISKALGISKGNLTFHFPTKEDLLLDLLKRLCDFQWIIVKNNLNNDNLVLAYCIEISIMAWICENNINAKELYLAAYRQDNSLKMIRELDTIKIENVFKKYKPNWVKENFKNAEYLISGIEYALLCSAKDKDYPINNRLAITLRLMLSILGVSDNEIKALIDEVYLLDCEALGNKVLNEFIKYINEQK